MDGREATSGAAEPIPVEQVDDTQRELAGFEPERIRVHGERFMDEQPERARFLTTLTRDAGGPSAELTFYLGCILWTMFDRTYGARLQRGHRQRGDRHLTRAVFGKYAQQVVRPRAYQVQAE